VRGLNDFFFGERVGVLLGGVEEREREGGCSDEWVKGKRVFD